MAISQKKSNRKPTGGRYKKTWKKTDLELGSKPTLTKLEPIRKRIVRTLGGHQKVKLFSTEMANVYDPKTKSYKVVKIQTITDNSANRNYIRRNIITKGAVVKTELGEAKVTSRPGQVGIVNAVLIKK